MQFAHRLQKLAGAGLDLFEQPGVLDCDHSLVSEGFDQCDLPGREGLHGPVDEAEHAERLALSQQRHPKGRPVAPDRGAFPPCVGRILLRILNVDGPALQSRAT